MKREEVNQDQYNKILECILTALMKNGLKGTTMDSIASNLQMSKRTLYEIFGSKDEMFREAHNYFNEKMLKALKEIFETSNNVMEAIIKCFLYNRDIMSSVNADFLIDIKQCEKKDNFLHQDHNRNRHQNLYEVLQRGVKEGYFREDVNLLIQCKMLIIQMEALKRTQELFNADISLLEVYDSIIIGFLRGISSSKGLEELEPYMHAFTKRESN